MKCSKTCVLVRSVVVRVVGMGLAVGLPQAFGDDKPKEQPKEQPATQPAEKPAAPVTPASKPAAPQTETKTDAAAEAPKPDAAKLVYVQFETTMGNIVLELNNEKAPISVANFLKYVDKGHYNGTVFHRVINNFMIQGGGFTKDGVQKAAEPPIKNEWQNGLKNTVGTIAMARLGGRADSASSQFFINVKDNGMLDQPNDGAGYAVFGKVVQGMDVVNKIKGVKTGVNRTTGMQDWPVDNVEITKATRLTDADAKKLLEPAGSDAAPAQPAK